VSMWLGYRVGTPRQRLEACQTSKESESLGELMSDPNLRRAIIKEMLADPAVKAAVVAELGSQT